MHATTWRLAEQEMLRFLRRRETFWTLLGAGALLFVLSALAIGSGNASVAVGGLSAGLVDAARSFCVALEVLLLWIIAIQAGIRAVREELDTGSWILLAQTPNPASRLWAGKLLGAAVSLLGVHSFLSLSVLAFTPFVRRSQAEVAALFVGLFAYAAAVVPEGMLYGMVGSRWPRLVWLLYPATLCRIFLPVPVLFLAVRPDFVGDLPGREALVRAIAPVSVNEGLDPEIFANPWVPLVIVVAVQLVSAIPYWVALVRTRR